jgi:hypothetical protein
MSGEHEHKRFNTMSDEPNTSADTSGAAPTDASTQSATHAQALLSPLQGIEAPETLRLAVTALTRERAASRSNGLASRVGELVARVRGLVGSPVETTKARGPLRPALDVDGHSRARESRRLVVAGALATAAIAAIAALTVGLAGHAGERGRIAQPTVPQAARLGLAKATLPAPNASPTDAAVLDRSAGGISFPNWRPQLGWQASGARSDRLRGHTVTTVFYEPAAGGSASQNAEAGSQRDYGRVGYAIVEGSALPIPGGRTTTSHGIAFHTLRADGATVLTWRRAGHTCILVAKDVSSRALMRLATWE